MSYVGIIPASLSIWTLVPVPKTLDSFFFNLTLKTFTVSCREILIFSHIDP
jgi:hypothetical protein